LWSGRRIGWVAIPVWVLLIGVHTYAYSSRFTCCLAVSWARLQW
jgi:hypothetical protein